MWIKGCAADEVNGAYNFQEYLHAFQDKAMSAALAAIEKVEHMERHVFGLNSYFLRRDTEGDQPSQPVVPNKNVSSNSDDEGDVSDTTHPRGDKRVRDDISSSLSSAPTSENGDDDSGGVGSSTIAQSSTRRRSGRLIAMRKKPKLAGPNSDNLSVDK